MLPALLLVLSCALDFAVLWLLVRRGERPLGLARLTLALLVAVVVALVKMPLFAYAAGSFFFGVTLGWVTLVVVTPLVAWRVLLRGDATHATRAFAIVGALGLPLLGIYGSVLEPRYLQLERVEVPITPAHAPAEPLRIAVLADIQSRSVDEHLRTAVREAMRFEPHLIVLPGDLVQLESEEEYLAAVPQFRELLQPLDAPLGVYFVIGNTDTDELVARVFEGTRVRLLVDESIELEFAGRRIVLGGADILQLSPSSPECFVSRFDRRDADELRILVSHLPDHGLTWLSGQTPGIDLAIAGHTHGGQVTIPGFGPPVTLSSVPRAVAAGGLHRVQGRQIYVSRGIGMERGLAPPLRLICPPEVSLLTLVPTRDER